MHKIAITTTSFGEFNKKPLRLLKIKGFTAMLNPYKRKLERKEIVNLCKDAIGIIAGTETLDAEIIEHLTKLRVISRCGSGLDNVDKDAAKKGGIKVFNTADAPTLAVAELTVGLIIGLLRKINQMDATVRIGKWEKLTGNLLSGKKVGIIGFGKIGKKFAELLKPFHCEIAYTDPVADDRLSGLKRLSKEDLLKWADIISIHICGKDNIIGKDEFALMKKESWIINTSRPDAIDEAVLYKYLKSGHILGAALDVFKDEPYNGPLRALDNVILTPHVGSYAQEARVKMEIEAVRNLLVGLRK